MTTTHLEPHPDRVSLANELHARPFPIIQAPGYAAAFALERTSDDPQADTALLAGLLDHFGAAHPAPGANHHLVDLGRVQLQWERHTEFVTFTLLSGTDRADPLGADLFDELPIDWMSTIRARLLTSVLVRVEHSADIDEAAQRMQFMAGDWFHPESMATALVLDREAAIVGDFKVDARGHIRFAVIAIGATGPNRIGRIVQRLIEIETYKTMSLLTLPIARDVFARLTGIDKDLGDLMQDLADGSADSAQVLDRLLDMSNMVEAFSARTAFRFSAAEAYSAIVHQRIKVLGEERFAHQQLFSEFMMRRFEPAMRTCRSANRRLADISGRASRASRLLSTRVTVNNNAQNQQLLEQMDRRAALQMRLQETVEGLSVVAISYYAVNLATKALTPVLEPWGIHHDWLGAALVPITVLAVWLGVRRIRRSFAKASSGE